MLCKFAVFIILSDFVLAILIRFVFPSNIGVDVGVRVEVGCWS